MLGGPKAPGIGFAIGEDRLILTLQAQDPLGSQSISAADIFLAPLGASQNAFALKVARQLRNVWLPNLSKLGFKVHVGDGNFRLKKSFELAERCRASFIGIIGDEEQRMEVVTVKDLVSGEQSKKTIAELISLLSQGDEALKRLKEDLADIRA
jgi:histidyl-tRNA synthetase